jgi:hypothetical protein
VPGDPGEAGRGIVGRTHARVMLINAERQLKVCGKYCHNEERLEKKIAILRRVLEGQMLAAEHALKGVRQCETYERSAQRYGSAIR